MSISAEMVQKYGKAARMVGKCRACGGGVQTQTVWTGGMYFHADGKDHNRRAVCACGAVVAVRPVVGKHNASIKCDARCEHATGGSCECACGGANHGAGH